jgi:hypothetical protein
MKPGTLEVSPKKLRWTRSGKGQACLGQILAVFSFSKEEKRSKGQGRAGHNQNAKTTARICEKESRGTCGSRDAVFASTSAY